MQDNFNDDITELILRYMDNELAPAEKITFEERLQKDPALHEHYLFLLSARQAIQSYGVQQRVNSLYAEYANETAAGTKPAAIVQRTSAFKMFMRVAAAVAVVFFSYAVYEYSSTDVNSVYSDYYTPYTLPVNRGGDTAAGIENLYNSGNYAAALQQLENKPQRDQRDYFIEGQCYLQTGKPVNAIKSFKQVEALNAQNHQAFFADETDFYLLLAFIKAGDVQAAQQKLDSITSNRQHLFYKNAADISRLKLKVLRWKQP